MIPTVIVVAAIVRRWPVVVVAALAWPIIVSVWGDVGELGGFIAAGAVAGVNAAVGVVLGKTVAAFIRVARPASKNL